MLIHNQEKLQQQGSAKRKGSAETKARPPSISTDGDSTLQAGKFSPPSPAEVGFSPYPLPPCPPASWPHTYASARPLNSSIASGPMADVPGFGRKPTATITPTLPRTSTLPLSYPPFLFFTSTSSSVLFFSFAAEGVHSNSLVLGPPSSVNFISYYLSYFTSRISRSGKRSTVLDAPCRS